MKASRTQSSRSRRSRRPPIHTPGGSFIRKIAIALVVSGLLAVPVPASAKAYGGEYRTKDKCMKAMSKEQKEYRRTHSKRAPQLLLRCKHKNGRYVLVRD